MMCDTTLAIQRPGRGDQCGSPLSSPLFTQEREEQAGRRPAYHSSEESLLSIQSLSIMQERRDPNMN